MFIHPDMQITAKAMCITDPFILEHIIEERRKSQQDYRDEMWDGVYFVPPIANNEHQGLVSELTTILTLTVDWKGLGAVYPGVNVSDREEGWMYNFRAPDVVVFFEGNRAKNCGTHWCGGPDFLIEIVSPKDQSREKIRFYSKVGVREMLIIDRDPWALELYRLQEDTLRQIGRSTVEQPEWLICETVPLRFRLQPGEKPPIIEVRETQGDQSWKITGNELLS